MPIPPASLLAIAIASSLLMARAALAADAHGTYTATATYTCSGTGEFVDAEDLCEACDSDGTWDVTVAPAPSAGSLAGSWSLFVANTDYCPDEDPDPSPRELAFPPFAVTQMGAGLSATFLGPAPDLVGDFLGTPCSASCSAPGSCNISCPGAGVSCSVSCSPATEDCRDRYTLSGTNDNGTLEFAMSRGVTATATCPGHGTLTIADGATAQFTGVVDMPEPGAEAGALLAMICMLARRGRSGDRRGAIG